MTTSDNLTTSLSWDILYGDGVVISSTKNGEQTNYTYGLERISAQTGKTRTEYVYDGRGSVAAEVTYNNAWYTFGGGLAKKDVTTKSYTPFGEQIGEATSGFGYNGEYYNAATGLIYLRARFYAPEMNRFSQKDLLRGSTIYPLSLHCYAYCYNSPIVYVDISGREAIVISGGDYNDSGEEKGEGLNSYNFITPALGEIQRIREAGVDSHITWIVTDTGWSPDEIERFKTAAGADVSVEVISNAEELTHYINTKKDASSQKRKNDKITYMSLYSHGTSNIRKAGQELRERDFSGFISTWNEIENGEYSQIDLGYNYTPNHRAELIITKDDVAKWDSDAFSPTTKNPSAEACVKLYACYTASGQQNSIAYEIASQTGLPTYGYTWQSSYSSIVSKPVSRLAEKIGITDKKAREHWNSLQNGVIQASVNPPVAGTGSITNRISPSGSIKVVNSIPTLNEPSLGARVMNAVKSAWNTIKGWFK